MATHIDTNTWKMDWKKVTFINSSTSDNVLLRLAILVLPHPIKYLKYTSITRYLLYLETLYRK